MAQLFPMPQLGSTMEEGTILKWLKREGDSIRKGDTLLEIETDKATMEVESPIDGVVLKLLFDNDAVVAVQRPIAILGSTGDPIEHLLGSDPGIASARAPINASTASASIAAADHSASTLEPAERVFLSPRARKLADERGIASALLAGRGSGPGGRVVERDVAALSSELARGDMETTIAGKARRTTPLAARLADDLGIDLNDLAFGLPGSRVRRDDILRHVEAAPAQLQVQPSPVLSSGSLTSGGQYTVRPFAGMRKRIADNVSKSRFTAPHVTLTIEVDMTECTNLRTHLIPEIEKAFGTRVSYTDILVKAAARALDEHPAMNSALVGEEIRIYRDKNIGVAVALEEGLIVPVVQQVGSKSLGAVSAELKQLIERARDGKFTPDDIAGGTFTITNLGSFGIDQFDPIIVPPQAGILGVCRIAERAVVVNKQVVVRSMMNLCLSFDHRIIDGAPAAAFLQRLKQMLENPVAILI